MPRDKRFGPNHAMNIQHGDDPEMTLFDALAGRFGKSGAAYWIALVEDNYKVRFQAACRLGVADDFLVVNLILWCPFCGAQHIDAPEPEIGWTNPPHRSHKCAVCECIWRPADCNTNGIAKIETVGKDDWIMLGTTAHIFSSDPYRRR
jgi:hypothetical protein